MVYVIATIELLPGHRDEFLGIFRALVPTVLAEEGCLGYEPTVDVEVEMEVVGPSRTEVVTVVEKWSSVAALQVHLTAPHMTQFREQVKALVDNVSLRILEPAN